jgi:hypothetical protein
LTSFCARLLSLSLLVALLTACSPRTMLVRNVANELAGQGQAGEGDIVLAREASALYLKLSESVLPAMLAIFIGTMLIAWIPILATGLPSLFSGR